MSLDDVTDLVSSAELARELDEFGVKVRDFVKSVGTTADSVDVWIERRRQPTWHMRNAELLFSGATPSDRVVIRLGRDDQLHEWSTPALDSETWRDLTQQAPMRSTATSVAETSAPRSSIPGPVTFDGELADALAPRRELHRITQAIATNVRHESERIPGLNEYAGHVSFTSVSTVVGNGASVVGGVQGGLQARIEVNGQYGDVYGQVHGPESFLPLALLGARTWRTMPREEASIRALRLGKATPVVLHPRVLEILLRKVPLSVFYGGEGEGPFESGETIASPRLTLVDDPGLDGLWSSRGYDDEGRSTRRSPLIVRGRLTRSAGGRGAPKRLGQLNHPGNWWRRAPGGGQPILERGLSSLLIERGEVSFHDLVGSARRTLLIQDIGEPEVLGNRGEFRCPIRWALGLERGGDSRVVPAQTLQLEGRLFGPSGRQAGLLTRAVLSRELYDTGSGILPYCLTQATVTETNSP